MCMSWVSKLSALLVYMKSRQRNNIGVGGSTTDFITTYLPTYVIYVLFQRMNKTVFAFLIVLFTVEVVAFVLCHYIVGETNGTCATVLAVLTVSISLAFLVVTFFVSYYRKF